MQLTLITFAQYTMQTLISPCLCSSHLGVKGLSLGPTPWDSKSNGGAVVSTALAVTQDCLHSSEGLMATLTQVSVVVILAARLPASYTVPLPALKVSAQQISPEQTYIHAREPTKQDGAVKIK